MSPTSSYYFSPLNRRILPVYGICLIVRGHAECYTIIIRQSAGNINYFFLRRAVYILQAFKFPHKQVIVKTYRFQKGSMCESARSGADFMEF